MTESVRRTRAVFEEAVLDLLRFARTLQAAVVGSDTLARAVLGAVVAPFTADSPLGPGRPHPVN
jgi:hypothetical protein